MPVRAVRLRRRRRQGHFGLPVILAAVAVLLILLICFGVDRRLRPAVEQMAQSRVGNRVILLINSAVSSCVEREELTYEDLISVKRDETGQITSLTSDLASVTMLRTRAAADIIAGVDQLREEKLGIPLGTITGWLIFSGKGPMIRVELLSLGEADLQLRHEFEGAGINQTVHRIYLDTAVTMELMIPGEILTKEVSTSVCVAETVIIGKVPETYFYIGTGG